MDTKICKKCGVGHPTSNFKKSKDNKDGLHGSCKICMAAYDRAWREENKDSIEARRQNNLHKIKSQQSARNKIRYQIKKEDIRSQQKEYYQNNPDKARAAAEKRDAWAIRNRERVRETSRLWAQANKERVSRRHSEYNKQNKDKRRAYKANRRAAIKKAIPRWFNAKLVALFYTKARRLEVWLGESMHVDHIVPLQSDTVCGLHCAENLQILTKSENSSKSNRWWPDMWESIDYNITHKG